MPLACVSHYLLTTLCLKYDLPLVYLLKSAERDLFIFQVLTSNNNLVGKRFMFTMNQIHNFFLLSLNHV